MAQLNFRGARGSNAGDAFHALWALRQVLLLLDRNSKLGAVGVEGLGRDEDGTSHDTWDGVDCTLYYGGDRIDTADCIVIAQLKYSSANPNQAWTVSRLTQSNKPGKSVFGKLAKAFASLKCIRPDLVKNDKLIVKLVSNQPIDSAVVDALSDQDIFDQCSENQSSNRASLLEASTLDNDTFADFAKAFDTSECGHESRFALEERALRTVSEWTEEDAQTNVDHLMRFVQKAMLPERTNELITQHMILAQLGFSDRDALFPCPNQIQILERPISRKASSAVVEKMQNGKQRICLYGGAGCGKTTAIQALEGLLPPESVVIVFDCYGGGSYLNSDAYRHRLHDAFLQLSNELAIRLRIPLLVSRSENLDYPRVFKKQLENAAQIVASQSENAFLVIVIDAADNSVVAAKTRSPAEQSFVHDFMALGSLPENVRFVVTTRTGRLSTLGLPSNFEQYEIDGFTLDETTKYVRERRYNATEAWNEDFHYLSNGNPRVQKYALDYAQAVPSCALDFLRPHGKTLNQVFQKQIKYAQDKTGGHHDIEIFCAGLVTLPRPIPISTLAAVTGLTEEYIHDLCLDLAPGMRLEDRLLGFADEDFEDFIHAEATEQVASMNERIADHLFKFHESDSYAATHVAASLFAAGRGQAIIELIHSDPESKAIGDPVLRREAQLQRLRLAMKVCREAGDVVDMMLTLLIGAAALNTDAAIREMFINCPDLAANFARETASRMILRSAKDIGNHGPLLCHIAAVDARDQDGISVREGRRQFKAWIHRCRELQAEQKGVKWSVVHDQAIVALTEAVLRIENPKATVKYVWHLPRVWALRVALLLPRKLIVSSEASLLEDCLIERSISPLWDFFLLVPLALAGKHVDTTRLENSLESLLRHRLIRLDEIVRLDEWQELHADYYETILTACEVAIARGGNRVRIMPVLECFADPELRRRNNLSIVQVARIDFTMRAYFLIAHLAGCEATLESYIVESSGTDEKPSRELEVFIEPFFDIYNIRTQALLGLVPTDDIDSQLRNAISSYQDQEYQYRTQGNFHARAMKEIVAHSLTRLMALPALSPDVLFGIVDALLDLSSVPSNSAKISVFESLSLNSSLHEKIFSAANDNFQQVRDMKMASEDKISILTGFVRLLLPISRADAESLFQEVIDVTNETNCEAVHEVALFEPLSRRSVTSMNIDQRRAVARDLAVVIDDAGVRLQGYDHFPWREAVRTLTTLDISLGLAATARWADSDIVNCSEILPSVLDVALCHRVLSPVQIASFSPLLEHLDTDLIGCIVERAQEQEDEHDRNALTEHLAREELLRFGKGQRPQVSEQLSSLLTKNNYGFWLIRLLKTTAFCQDKDTAVTEEPESFHRDNSDTEQFDTFTNIDFVSARGITAEIASIQSDAKASQNHVSASTILDRIRGIVGLSDRTAHLEALSLINPQDVNHYEITQAIAKCIHEWYEESPSVRSWCQERLMQVVIDLLPGFSVWLEYGDSCLPGLLAKINVPDQKICDTLLEGMEHHVDVLGSSTIYALVGLVGQFCKPEDAKQVMERYAVRLVQRIPPSHQDNWNLSDIPVQDTEGISRFLYALMGDVNVQIRWRAVHVLRGLVRLGNSEILNCFIDLYDKTSEASYRQPNAPFYWLAARLWLVIALDRIADETPVGEHLGQWLFAIATNEDFPHVFVRAFAKSAVAKLCKKGVLTLAEHQKKILDHVNVSPLPPEAVGHTCRRDFNMYSDQRENRRFHFDGLETLRYWYIRPLKMFANLEREEFLQEAERWIVECWNVTESPRRWNEDGREHRFSRSPNDSARSHGSMPVLERFRIYLEWHAMWCATGSLMRNHAFAASGDGVYDTFEEWIRAECLSSPPIWLSDLHGPKPLKYQLWFSPLGNIDAWVDRVVDADFLAEIDSTTDSGSIVVGGNRRIGSGNFYEVAYVTTSLVSPDTAHVLVRALQAIKFPFFYRLPSAGGEDEIDCAPYKLMGWLDNVEHELGIEEHDPLRYGMYGIQCRPTGQISKALNLEFVFNDHAAWIDTNSGKRVFVYEEWSDNRGDEREERYQYDSSVRSSGWCLRINKASLKTLLEESGLDLIVKIRLTRRNKDYGGYRSDAQKKIKESEFARIVVLRRNGTMEGAKGHLGTWTAPCA